MSRFITLTVLVILVLLTTSIILSMNASSITNAKPTLIYIPDALCSHSYGFEPQMRKIKAHFGDRLNFELINGGLRPYGTKRIIESAEFLRNHWKEIEAYSGQPFNYQLLESETYVVNSEPPARAVVVCREMAPEKELEFFFAVERLVFFENKDVNQLESYYGLLPEFGLDTNTFSQLFNSPRIKEKTKTDFEKTASLGVNGFPSILVKRNDNYIRISRGYTKAETVIANIEKIISEQ